VAEGDAVADELSPLLQRHVSASVEELRAAVTVQVGALDSHVTCMRSDIQGINERSERMEAQLQELLARANAIAE
jgi:chaperonin cofactor prefoldin